MDPFKIIMPEMHELLLQHLSCEEILESSKVSPLWSKVIGTSQHFSDKVWLNVGNRTREPSWKDVKAFRTSRRKYVNFKISEMENGLQILTFPRRKWNRAKIDIQSFTTLAEYENLLEILSESVVDLEIFDMHIDVSFIDQHEKNLKFEQLVRLKFSWVTFSAVIPFEHTMKNLKKLIIDDIHGTDDETDDAKNILTNFISLQSNLTHLKTSSDIFIMLMTSSNNCKFDLEFLHIEQSQEFPDNDDVALQNLRHFVSTQVRLKWLILSDWTAEQSFHIFFSLPKLERISIEYFDSEIKKIKLVDSPKSLTLKRIDFECEDARVDWIQLILRHLASIKVVYFFHISSNLLKVLTEMKNLECIKFCSIFDGYGEILENCKVKQKLEEEKYVDYRNII